jgi:hypothetical protein
MRDIWTRVTDATRGILQSTTFDYLVEREAERQAAP